MAWEPASRSWVATRRYLLMSQNPVEVRPTGGFIGTCGVLATDGQRRTYYHDVQLDADGSALITTRVTIRNTGEPGRFNKSSLSYLSMYGLRERSSTRRPAIRPSLNPRSPGHPAAGWFRQAPPGDETSATVTWEAPANTRPVTDDMGDTLTWTWVPVHSGDVLNLDVRPPDGWEWDGPDLLSGSNWRRT